MTTSNELAVVKAKVLSIIASLETIDAEKEQIKSVIDSLKTEHGIEPKVVRKTAKMIHKNQVQDFHDEMKELETLLSAVQ